jgi:hypothetical protein
MLLLVLALGLFLVTRRIEQDKEGENEKDRGKP